MEENKMFYIEKTGAYIDFKKKKLIYLKEQLREESKKEREKKREKEREIDLPSTGSLPNGHRSYG